MSGPLAGSSFVAFLPSSWSLSIACGSGSRSSGATPVSGPPPPSASTPAGQPTSISRLQMQLHLRGLQNSTSDLRSQLQQLRKLQVLRAPGPRPVPRPLQPLRDGTHPLPLTLRRCPWRFTGPPCERFLPRPFLELPLAGGISALSPSPTARPGSPHCALLPLS